jgi:hypothetical protein
MADRSLFVKLSEKEILFKPEHDGPEKLGVEPIGKSVKKAITVTRNIAVALRGLQLGGGDVFHKLMQVAGLSRCETPIPDTVFTRMARKAVREGAVATINRRLARMVKAVSTATVYGCLKLADSGYVPDEDGLPVVEDDDVCLVRFVAGYPVSRSRVSEGEECTVRVPADGLLAAADVPVQIVCGDTNNYYIYTRDRRVLAALGSPTSTIATLFLTVPRTATVRQFRASLEQKINKGTSQYIRAFLGSMTEDKMDRNFFSAFKVAKPTAADLETRINVAFDSKVMPITASAHIENVVPETPNVSGIFDDEYDEDAVLDGDLGDAGM